MLYKDAKEGCCFVMTEKGMQRTLLRGTEQAKRERMTGKPIKGWETKVPTGWIEEGWVEEVPCKPV